MDFSPTPQVESLLERIKDFNEEHVFPVEMDLLKALDEEVRVGAGQAYPDGIVELRERAKSEGLWNLFMPDERYGAGLSNWEYGLLCEEMGRSLVAPMVYNCSAPDTGNMEILAEHGSEEQRQRWLRPLLEDHVRSCFSMTEPETAGSDPTGLATRAELDGDEWVINGHKWFTSGAVGASLAIAMVVTDPDAAPHKRASMILVPTDAPGFNLIRPVSVMGHDGGPGHCEIVYDDCRVPADEPARRARRGLQGRAGPPRPGPDPPLHARGGRRPSGPSRSCAGGPTSARRSAASWPRSSSSRTSSPARRWTYTPPG